MLWRNLLLMKQRRKSGRPAFQQTISRVPIQGQTGPTAKGLQEREIAIVLHA